MFKVGQKVWSIMFGEGEVMSFLTSNARYPMVVNFGDAGLEQYTLDGKYHTGAAQTLYPYPVEVVKKVTKPSIDWEHVREDFKFLAQDIDGNAFLYWEKPVLRETGWQTTRGDCAEAQQFASYIPGTCDWEDSLVERP